VEVFAPAREIDPDYAKALKIAVNSGVEVIAMLAKVTPEKIELLKKIPFEI
jgi:sugar fermentation stimulation protein A